MLSVEPLYDKLTDTLSILLKGQISDEYKVQFHNIASKYEVEGIYFHPDKKDKLKHKNLRTCRYCHNRIPEVTFNKTAHIIPELLGNRNLISDSECDSCNILFSKYEDSLANFFGIMRTLSAARGKEGIPTFKNPDKKLEARKNGLIGSIDIRIDGLNKEYFDIDETGTKLTIKATRHSYKPLYVYKSLLKIAFGLLNEQVLPQYQLCEKFLLSDIYDDQVKGHPYLKLFGFFIPGPQFPFPWAIIWRKKELINVKNIPIRTMVIYFQNYVFQIFIPFGPKDEENNKVGNPINFNLLPPFMDERWIQRFGKPEQVIIDFSSKEFIKGDKQNVTITFTEPIFKDFHNK